MTRKKLRLDELEVDSFVTHAKEVPAVKQEREGGVQAYNSDTPCDYSWMYGGTAICDTDRDCSGVCLRQTNVCGPCEP